MCPIQPKNIIPKALVKRTNFDFLEGNAWRRAAGEWPPSDQKNSTSQFWGSKNHKPIVIGTKGGRN